MKLSKRIKFISLVSAAACAIAAVGVVLAAEYSTEDPLISKSYLDQVYFKQITDYIDSKISSLPENEPEKAPETAVDSASSQYQVITLTKGQTLSAVSSLEFILRPGSSATVVSPIAENGIANLTDATELYNNAEIPINAYCLIPRGDGRGIVCTSETAYVMVRGTYEIK
ncbi:MAG: hypothetical protein IKI97_12405 [Clostridia bacterium]|nr:hypothetical protein [Clostridia bacterium]